MNRRQFLKLTAAAALVPAIPSLPDFQIEAKSAHLWQFSTEGIVPVAPNGVAEALAQSMLETKERVAANIFMRNFGAIVTPGLNKVFDQCYDCGEAVLA